MTLFLLLTAAHLMALVLIAMHQFLFGGVLLGIVLTIPWASCGPQVALVVLLGSAVPVGVLLKLKGSGKEKEAS